MGVQSSTLDMRMIDNVTGPAAGVDAALKRTRASTQGLVGANRQGAMTAGLLGATMAKMAGLAAGYFSVQTAREALKVHQEEERAWARIGYAARLTAEETRKAHHATIGMANAAGVSAEGLEKAVSVLVTGTKRTMEESLKIVPIIAAVQNVTGAAPENVARLADAMQRIMGIPTDQMWRAFEMMGTAARYGNVQITDMIAGMPRLAEAMTRIGYTGVDGWRKVLSVVEAMSARTADVNEAFAQTEMLLNLTGRRSVAAFKKVGVDVIGILTDARKKGIDELEAIANAIWKRIGGDVNKLKGIVQPEMEMALRNFFSVYKGVRDIHRETGKYTDELQRKSADLAASGAGDAARLANAWREFYDELGGWDNTGVLGFFTGIMEAATQTSHGLRVAIDLIRMLRGQAPTTEGMPKTFAEYNEMARRKELSDRRDAEKLVNEARIADLEKKRLELRKRMGGEGFAYGRTGPATLTAIERAYYDKMGKDLETLRGTPLPSQVELDQLEANKAAREAAARQAARDKADELYGAKPYVGPWSPLPGTPTVPVETERLGAVGEEAGNKYVNGVKSAIEAGIPAIKEQINRIINMLNFNAAPTVTPKVTPQSMTPGDKYLGGKSEDKTRSAYNDFRYYG